MFVSANLFSQGKVDNVWLFGRDNPPSSLKEGFRFDFEDDVLIDSINLGSQILSANASICDDNGDLLFYTNGCRVLNNNHEIMLNGDSISYDTFFTVFGRDCDRGTSGFQDNIILKNPQNNKQYYLIHKPRIYNGVNIPLSIELWYSIIDLEKDGGKGDVIEKNVKLFSEKEALASYLTAIQHSNNKDWWIIQPVEDSLFATFLIDDSGITFQGYQNSNRVFTRDYSSAGGTAKFSPDGRKYALYNEFDGLLLYEFNRQTGRLTFDEKVIPFDTSGLGIFCSVEWSPNSRFVYTATTTKLHQIDTWETNIQENGVRLIDVYNGTVDPFATAFFLMALAPNCKIYMTPTSSTNSFHVINNPNRLGDLCNFDQNGVKLPRTSSLGSMPNFARVPSTNFDLCAVTKTEEHVEYSSKAKLFPSPTKGIVNIQFPNSFDGHIDVLDNYGNTLKSTFKEHAREATVDIGVLNPGIYFIHLVSNETREIHKVLKVD